MPLTIYSKEQIRFQPQLQRFLELFHRKVMFCNSTETHWNSFNWNIFWCIPVILCESNYFIMLISEMLFFLFLGLVVPRYKSMINLKSKLCLYYIQVCLSLWSNSGNNISFLCSLLIKILLFPFCSICYGTFFGWPVFFVSLLIIWNNFSTLFYCHHHWMD